MAPGGRRSRRRRQLPTSAPRSISRTAFAALSVLIGDVVVADVIVELGDLALEAQLDRADRAMALLGDDDFGEPGDALDILRPAVAAVVELVVGLVRPAHRLGTADIVFLAEDEHDDVGVLFDRARFAEVGQHWPLVLAVLDRARELRQRHDRDVELLGDALETAGNLRNLLHAVLGAAPIPVALHELEVIDDDEVEPFLPLEPPCTGPQRGYG